MTKDDEAGDGESVATLQTLIRTRMAEEGWSYADLERLSGGRVSKPRWQQLGSGIPQKRFPDPETMEAIAEIFGYDRATVLHAAAATVGYSIQRSGALLAHLLPSGTEMLSQRTQDAVLTMLRAVVADTVEFQRQLEQARGEAGEGGSDPPTLRALDQ